MYSFHMQAHPGLLLFVPCRGLYNYDALTRVFVAMSQTLTWINNTCVQFVPANVYIKRNLILSTKPNISSYLQMYLLVVCGWQKLPKAVKMMHIKSKF